MTIGRSFFFIKKALRLFYMLYSRDDSDQYLEHTNPNLNKFGFENPIRIQFNRLEDNLQIRSDSDHIEVGFNPDPKQFLLGRCLNKKTTCKDLKSTKTSYNRKLCGEESAEPRFCGD